MKNFKRQILLIAIATVFSAIGWARNVTAESISSYLIQAGVVDGKFELSGAIPDSNKFKEDFFWEFNSTELSRAGFDDGDLHPFVQWPADKHLGNGEWATTTVGEFHGRKCVEVYWSNDSYENWKNGNARLGKGIEIESPWKKDGFKSQKEIWYVFDLLVPEPPAFPDDKKQAIAQIFQITNNSGGTWAGLLVIDDNALVIQHRGHAGSPTKKVIVDSIPRGEWKEVCIHTVASNKRKGKVKIWYGGEKVYSRTGINFGFGAWTAEDRLDGDGGAYQFVKCGHYAFNPDNYDSVDERTLYFDNITNFNGRECKLPLRVEAENYNKSEGGTVKNPGGRYRPEESVDIKVGQGAYYVDVTSGRLDWLQYIVEIPETGPYSFNFRTASERGGGKFEIVVLDSKNKRVYSESLEVPETEEEGDQWKWTNIETQLGTNLEAGKYAVIMDIKKRRFCLDWWEAKPYPDGQSRIALNSGKILQGEIVGYKNGNLQIADEAKEETKGSIRNVKRILFSHDRQAEIELKSGEVLKGKIVSYENGTLQIVDEEGEKIRGQITDLKRFLFNRHSQDEAGKE